MKKELPLQRRWAVLSLGEPGGKSGQERALYCGKRRWAKAYARGNRK